MATKKKPAPKKTGAKKSSSKKIFVSKPDRFSPKRFSFKSKLLFVGLVAVVGSSLLYISFAATLASGPVAVDESVFFQDTNNYRTARGVPALIGGACLRDRARAWSKTMAAQNNLHHEGSIAGETSFDKDINRYCGTGTTLQFAGENVGWQGPCDNPPADNCAQSLFNDMVGEVAPNDGHKQNILSNGARYTGVGTYYDASTKKLWITQEFLNCFNNSCAIATYNPTPPPAPTASTRPLDFIETAGTASGTVEIHETTGPSNYQTTDIASATRFPLSLATKGNFQMVGKDLYYVETSGTASGKVEIHVATAASGYKSGLDVATAFSTSLAANGTFQMVGNNLYYIETANTGSGKVELHVVTGASNYQTYSLHAATYFALSYASKGSFRIVGNSVAGNNLAWIATKSTGSGKVELHIVTAASGYQTFSLHAVTAFTPTDATNGYFSVGDANGNGAPDLGYIKTANTGSGKIELFYAYNSNYGVVGYSRPTSFAGSLGPKGTWQIGW